MHEKGEARQNISTRASGLSLQASRIPLEFWLPLENVRGLWYSCRCPASLECSLAGVLGERIVSARKRRVRPPRPAKVRRCEEPGDPRDRLGGFLSEGAGGFSPLCLSDTRVAAEATNNTNGLGDAPSLAFIETDLAALMLSDPARLGVKL